MFTAVNIWQLPSALTTKGSQTISNLESDGGNKEKSNAWKLRADVLVNVPAD